MFSRKEDCHNIESVNVNLFIYSTKNEESIGVKEKISSLIKCEQFNVLLFRHCILCRYSFHIKLEVKVLITYIHFMFVGCFNLMTLNGPGWPPGPLL